MNSHGRIDTESRPPLTPLAKNSQPWNSLPDMWDFVDRECGSRTAVVDPLHPPTDEGGTGKAAKGEVTRLTYGEMRANVDKMASAFIRLGVNVEVGNPYLFFTNLFVRQSSYW